MTAATPSSTLGDDDRGSEVTYTTWDTPSTRRHTSSEPIPAPTPMQIHPWLNGDRPSSSFFFDLSRSAFAPQRTRSSSTLQRDALRRLTSEEKRVQAFFPPLTAVRIFHPQLPFWPIKVGPSEDAEGRARPISVGDVLAAMHNVLQERIATADWETLSSEDQQRVICMFTRRCRAEAVRSKVPPAMLGDREAEERRSGVKRVDLLLGKTWFQGLVRSPGDPVGCVRMITA